MSFFGLPNPTLPPRRLSLYINPHIPSDKELIKILTPILEKYNVLLYKGARELDDDIKQSIKKAVEFYHTRFNKQKKNNP